MATFDKYAQIRLSAAQTARITVGNHVELDTIDYVGTLDSTSVSLATGAGQANGVVTLSGARFVVNGMFSGACNEGKIQLRLTDTSGTAIADEVATGIPAELVTRDSNQQDAGTGTSSFFIIVDASSADVDMELRIVAIHNPTQISQGTRLFVVPIA